MGLMLYFGAKSRASHCVCRWPFHLADYYSSSVSLRSASSGRSLNCFSTASCYDYGDVMEPKHG